MASVFIMCNPLMDLIIPATPEWVRALGAVPGSMNLVDYASVENILSAIPSCTRVPGGSGANTARGLAWLAGKDGLIERPLYLGAVGGDREGRYFEELLGREGVGSLLAVKDSLPTGVSAILVTPDHERTMFTFLGACRLLDTADLPAEKVRESRFLYLTGYNWDTPNQEEAAREAVREVRGAGGTVCFDVADPFVALRYRDSLRSWLPGRVDLLFANRDELAALTGEDGGTDEILRAAEVYAPRVVMKTGKAGCSILAEGEIYRIPGEAVVPRDTTAAGDSFAAGFLFGLLLDRDLPFCGRLANRLASRMVTVTGCDYTGLDRDDVLNLL